MTIWQKNVFVLIALLHVSFCWGAHVVTSKKTCWDNTKLRQIPVNYRTDGFSQYYVAQFPLTKERLEQEMVEPLAAGGIATIEWGLCAGSRVTYDSKVGQLFGDGLTTKQWNMMRRGDLRAYRNLTALIDSGVDPFTAAIEYAHKLGVKIFGRLEMNKEYGPIGSWDWLGFTDDFSKNHPEYRIPGSLDLDFKYKAVRDRKLALLREIAEKGCDGILADFLSRPVYFADPDTGRPVMTQFIRDIRRMLNEVGAAQNRHIEFMIRVSFNDSRERGLDWKTCMKEGLIDYISAYKGWPSGDYFDIRMDEFVAYRNQIKSKCKVYGHIWQALGLIDTDPSPTGKKRYSKPKTRGMDYAQALVYNRVGCDGIELGYASPQQWVPYLGTLGDPAAIEFANKHYMVDVGPYMPLVFDPAPQNNRCKIKKTVNLRVADDINKAKRSGYQVEANIILYCRALTQGETIEFYVNGNGPVLITAESLKGQNRGSFVSTAQINSKRAHNVKTEQERTFLNEPNWWRRGEKKILFPAEWLRLGDNRLDFRYSGDSTVDAKELEIVWVDLTLNYIK